MSSRNLAVALDPNEADFIARLDALVHRLAEPRHAIEQTFLDMGERLISCASLLREISAAHEGLPAELESAEFTAAAEILAAIRERVAQMALAHSDEQDDIIQLTRMASSVKKPLRDLSEAVRAIRFVAVNARVVAAGISSEQSTFSGSTNDMMDLGRSVESAVSEFSGSFGRLNSSLLTARSANASFTNKHGATMHYVSDRLGQHLDVVAQHRARAAEKAEENAQSIARISGRVAEAVSALQIGDITRQRVEHIEQGLTALSDYLAVADAAARAITIDATCRLQVAQLDDAIVNFDEQVAGLADTLGRLAVDTAAVLRENGEEAANLFSKGGTALAALIDDLHDICVLFNDFEKTRAGLQKIAAEVARSVSAMVNVMADHLDTIREIEQRIRMLSLNTVIQCTRLGEQGDPLMVVAQSLRSLAGDTVTAAETIMSELGEVDGLARRLIERRSTNSEGSVSPQQDAREAIALFETVISRMRECVGTMSTAGPQAVSLLETTLRSVSGRRDFADVWRSVHSDLEHLAPARSQPIAVDDIDPDLIAGMRARYTMDSERLLHDRLLGVTAEPAIAAPAEEAEASLDDIFF